MRRIRIGSRGSMLAMAQANWVKQQLTAHYPDLPIDLKIIKTSGDKASDVAISSIGGKGVFTKEIEEALLRDEIDLAVHSMKDMPTELPAGLMVAAVPKREDARDVLVTRDMRTFRDLRLRARIATGSLRRKAQLLHWRRDLTVVPIRGNIDTRLRKLDEDEADALVVAAAGLRRIGQEGRITEYLADSVCISAVGQGALGIEARQEDTMRELLRFLHDAATSAEVSAERSLLARLGGGCHVPVGARARVEGETLRMIGAVASPDGRSLCKGLIEGRSTIAAEIGRRLADQLLKDGAAKILSLS